MKTQMNWALASDPSVCRVILDLANRIRLQGVPEDEIKATLKANVASILNGTAKGLEGKRQS